VTFEGHVESVLDAYHAGDVVLLTSISEGFPYTLIEAMAAGKATVATDVGGVREATGGAGIIVPPRDPQRMADACLIFLNDIGLRNLVGRAARERILSRFTWTRAWPSSVTSTERSPATSPAPRSLNAIRSHRGGHARAVRHAPRRTIPRSHG